MAEEYRPPSGRHGHGQRQQDDTTYSYGYTQHQLPHAHPYSSYPMQPVASGSGSGSGSGQGSQLSSRAPSPSQGQRRGQAPGYSQQQPYNAMRHLEDPSKEHVEMQEVSRGGQYGGHMQPRTRTDSNYLHPQTAMAQQQRNNNVNHADSSSNPNKTAYAPAPLASASMADLTSVSSPSAGNRITGSSKKPKRVYNTAFGPFSWSDLVKRKYWKYYAILFVLSIVVLLAVIYHDDIIRWMQPIAEKIRDITAGWTIFVGVLFIISFPPLFGHEVVCLLCGLIYGLWWGFAIVALGTILGEWGNFIVFKYWCTARSKRMEEKDVTYACICRVIREGGFKIAFMARLSAIPGHLTTPAFAACGMGFWVFSITAIVTLPKQLMAVYLGTVFGEDDEELKEEDKHIKTSKIVEWVVLGISFLVTLWAAYYIYAKMAKWRPIVLAEMAANAEGAQAVLVDGQLADDGSSTQDHDTYGLSPAKQRLVPQVRLAKEQDVDDDGRVMQAGGRDGRRLSINRLSGMNRWSGGGDRNGNNGRHTSQMYNSRIDALADSSLVEEGSIGDLQGAGSPLMLSSASPAGHSSAHLQEQKQSRQRQYAPENNHDGRNLYPTDQRNQLSGSSPYSSSEEDMGMTYGYADGGEVYNGSAPNGYTESRNRTNFDPASSEDVSLRWQPPQTEDLPPGASVYPHQAQLQSQGSHKHSDEARATQASPAPSQYSPTTYRRQLQGGVNYQQQQQQQQQREPNDISSSYKEMRHPNTTAVSPEQSSSLPLSVPPAPVPVQSYASSYLQPDVVVQNAGAHQYQPHVIHSPESAPESQQALSIQGGSRGDIYPSDPHLMPQPQTARNITHVQTQMHQPSVIGQQYEPTSRYPEMRQPRPTRPVSSTNYHTGPAASSSRRYHTEADSSRESPYHTRALSPAPTYHTVMPTGQHQQQSHHQQQQHRHQQSGPRFMQDNGSRYPPSIYPPSEGPPRYETPT